MEQTNETKELDMSNGTITYTIDCGDQNPFRPGRKVERPEELDRQGTPMKLILEDGTARPLTVKAQTLHGSLLAWRGTIDNDQGNRVTAVFFFDTNIVRMNGITHTETPPVGFSGVWGAARDDR